MDFTDDLLVRLTNHRVTNKLARREDYLTECFAWLLENDPALASSLLGPGGRVYGHEHADLALNTSTLTVKTRYAIGRDRPEITITDGQGGALYVEAKVDADYDLHRLLRYLEHASESPRGAVLGIVPRNNQRAQEPHHVRFLGMLTWEEIAEQLAGMPPVGDARDNFRAWLLNLLKSYDLYPRKEKIGLAENQGRTLAEVLNAAATSFKPDRRTRDMVHDMYRIDKSAQLRTALTRTGGGTRQRILSQVSMWVPWFFSGYVSTFGTIRVVTGITPYSGERAQLKVGLDFSTVTSIRRGAKHEPHDFLCALVEHAGVVELADGQRNLVKRHTAELLKRHSVRTQAYMRRVRGRLDLPFGTPEKDPVTAYAWGTYAPLAPTAILCPPNATVETVTDRYLGWLELITRAVFEEHPEHLLQALIAEVVTLR